MNREKRKRGRPGGSEKKDDPYLSQVADLLIQTPSLKPTTAMKRVMAQETWRETLTRRWQVKWKERGPRFLAAAQDRARPRRTLRELVTSIDSSAVANFVESALQAALNRWAMDLQKAAAETTRLNQLVAQTTALRDLMKPSSEYLASMRMFELSMRPPQELVTAIKAFQDSMAPSPQIFE